MTRVDIVRPSDKSFHSACVRISKIALCVGLRMETRDIFNMSSERNYYFANVAISLVPKTKLLMHENGERLDSNVNQHGWSLFYCIDTRCSHFHSKSYHTIDFTPTVQDSDTYTHTMQNDTHCGLYSLV